METLTIVRLEWNNFNGFILDILAIEGWSGCFCKCRSLFGINIDRRFMYLDIFWISIKAWDLSDSSVK